jgi:hypothetical protein
MAVGDEYLSEAAKFSALTECETDPGKRAEFANLSRAYLRLALQAKGYSHTDGERALLLFEKISGAGRSCCFLASSAAR